MTYPTRCLGTGWLAVFLAAVVMAAGPARVAADPVSALNAPDLSRVEPVAPQPPAAGALLILHYHRPDGRYDGWNAWAWQAGREGRAFPFEGRDAFGVWARISFTDRTEAANFLIRLGAWEQKDVDQDRTIVFSPDGVAEAWLVAGDPAVYTDPARIDFGVRVRAAFLDRPDRVRVALSGPVDPRDIIAADIDLMILGRPVAVRRVRPVKPAGATLARALDLELARPVTPKELAGPITVQIADLDPAPVRARDALNDPAYTPDEPRLGPHYTRSATTFRTWSPVAASVDLLLYPPPGPPEVSPRATGPGSTLPPGSAPGSAPGSSPGNAPGNAPGDPGASGVGAGEPDRVVPLTRRGAGVWEATIEGDLHNTVYQYRFRSYGQDRVVADIHGYAATADSRRSVVVDLDRTDPAGWDDHPIPLSAAPTDEVIYEVHVRDFSIDDPAVPAEHRGRYLGLTHLNPGGPDRVSTGLSHLKDLGVTAVHLLPVQDYGAGQDEYNWGYWTSLFNVPEANYSTDPDNPTRTIRELKQTIQTLHEHGIRVILDVVYNHTSSSFEQSPFDQAVPGYYFRTTLDGRLRNESGCGNAFADERPMARRYMIDSLKFWAREYKVDGFRFDLLGMHHPETMRQVVRELRAIRPDLTLYGEPWTGGGPTHFGKGQQRGTTLAVFNDHLRNDLRGDLDGASTGFATGPGGSADGVRRGVMGAIDDFTDAPTESVNYVSAHDNRTFWDKLVYTHPAMDDATRLKMVKLAHGVVLTSQGISFLHGGSDFARTKGGHHNSYDAGDTVNRFDWDRKQTHRHLNAYITGLIAMRRAHPAFRMTTAQAVRRDLRWLRAPEGVIAFELDGARAGDTWDRILVVYNGEPEEAEVGLPPGAWTVVVDDARAGIEPIGTVTRHLTLPGYSLGVLHR